MFCMVFIKEIMLIQYEGLIFMSRGKTDNKNSYIALAAAVIILVAGGGYYYFGIYVPNYEAELEQLLTLIAVSDPIDLDPALSYDTESNRVIINIFDRLLKFKSGTTDVEPSLALSWETPDSMTFIFNLREDVYFHDGTKLDAESVKYSFDRVLELEGANQYLLAVVNKTEVIDPYTLKFELNYEFAPFLSVLAHPVASIVSPTAVDEYGADFTTNPVGSGPFKFESREPGKELILVAYEEYHLGAPKLKKLVFNPTSESSARKNALEQGTVDVVVDGILASDLPDLESNPDIQIFSTPSSTVEYLGYNTLVPPLNDSRVRRAITYALDYEGMIDEARGGRAERIAGPIPSTIFEYEELPLVERNLTLSQQLLNDAGYSDGFEITLTYNIESFERRQLAEIIQLNLEEVGITVKIKGLDWEASIDEYLAMEHELMLNSWIPDYLDPDAYLFPQYHSWSSAPYGANVFGLDNPEIDALIDQGTMSLDQEERLLAYEQAQQLIIEENICAYLFVPTTYDVVRYNVKNWVSNPSEYFEAYNLFKE